MLLQVVGLESYNFRNDSLVIFKLFVKVYYVSMQLICTHAN